jgi:hypothetical protein
VSRTDANTKYQILMHERAPKEMACRVDFSSKFQNYASRPKNKNKDAAADAAASLRPTHPSQPGEQLYIRERYSTPRKWTTAIQLLNTVLVRLA